MKKTVLIQTDDPGWVRNVESAQNLGWTIQEVPPAEDRASALNRLSRDGWNFWVKSEEYVDQYPEVSAMKHGIYQVPIYDGTNTSSENRLWFGPGVVQNPVFETIYGEFPSCNALIFCQPTGRMAICDLQPSVEKWIKKRPADRTANYYLAVCLLASNERERFVSQAQKFLHIFGREDQESNFIRFHLASHAARKRDFPKAIQCLTGVLASNVCDKAAWEGLAEVMMQCGLRSRAIAMLRNADLLSDSPDRSPQA